MQGQSQVDSVERSDHSHSTRPVSAQHSRGAFDGDVFPAVCATAGSPRLLLSHWDPLVKTMCSWYEGRTSDEMLIQQNGSLGPSSPKSEHVALAEKLIFQLARRRRLGASGCARRLRRAGDQGEPCQKPHQKGPPGLRAPWSCSPPLPFRAAGRGPVGHTKARKQALEKPGAPQGGVAGNCASQGLLVGGAGQGRSPCPSLL